MVALLLSSIEQKESIYRNDQDLICSLQKVRWRQKSTRSWFLGWKSPHCPRDSCRKLSRDMGCLFVCAKCRETTSGCRKVGWFGWGGGTSATLLGVALWGTKEELKNNSIAWCLATEGFMRYFSCEPLLYLLPQSLQIITVRGKEKKKVIFWDKPLFLDISEFHISDKLSIFNSPEHEHGASGRKGCWTINMLHQHVADGDTSKSRWGTPVGSRWSVGLVVLVVWWGAEGCGKKSGSWCWPQPW